MWFPLFVLITAISQCISTGCPVECECYYTAKYEDNELQVDCSGKYLEYLPTEIDNSVLGLDLSKNLFEELPFALSSLTSLERLNVSENKISYIRPEIISGLSSLIVLDLSNNRIVKWSDVNPGSILKSLVNIKKMILSNNVLGALNINLEEKLDSSSLEELILSNCGIPSGELHINGLSALRSLDLSYNPIRKFQIQSQTLETLDLSHCELTRLSHTGLNKVPNLAKLIVSHNYHLDVSMLYPLNSLSLQEIDLSFCNMNRISLLQIPNVLRVTLRGNMLRYISGEEFLNNSKMEYLDLSSNGIETLPHTAFNSLTSLKFLNLSLNAIIKIHEQTFSKMTSLITVILSRNQISYLGSLVSPSIIRLDLSSCEIQYISSDIFDNLYSIRNVSLSKNLIRDVPNVRSNNLQILDLSFNRISSIEDNTFKYLPKLKVLHLSENRFTSVFKMSYFANNTELAVISLGDNMWRCDCYDDEMKYFFLYLVHEPPKIRDMNSLICQSPSNVTDFTWHQACYISWNPHTTAQTNKIMNFLVATLAAFFICFGILYMIRKGMKRKLRVEEEERQREASEAREHLRQLEISREQQEMVNAPDPRDLISPPSYNEALLMPKLDKSFYSLSNLNQAGKKKKRARRRTKSSGDLLNDGPPETSQSRHSMGVDNAPKRPYKRTQSANDMVDNREDESDTNDEQPNASEENDTTEIRPNGRIPRESDF